MHMLSSLYIILLLRGGSKFRKCFQNCYRFWQLNSSFWQFTLFRWQMNLSCWQINSSCWLLNLSFWLLNSSLWHKTSSVRRLAAGVNMKTRCSNCVIILSKYNCCKQLLRSDNSSSTTSSPSFATVLRH